MKRSSLTALLVSLGLTGCASNAPLTYLVLSPVPGQVYRAAGPEIAVGRVSMPAAIDRSFLTTGTGENTVMVSYNAKWAAPLETLAQATLAKDLSARLPNHMVLMPGDHVPANTMIVSVNVSRFLPDATQVCLEADWRAFNPATQQARTGRTTIYVPTSSNATAQAQAMSQALGQLADHIAAQVSP